MDEHRERQFVLLGLALLVLLIYTARLAYLQVFSEEYAAKAEENAIKKVVEQPARGMLYDRQGRVYVSSEPLFELRVRPREFEGADTAALAQLLELPQPKVRNAIEQAADYSRNKRSVIVKQISQKRFSPLEEQLWRFPGLEPVVRNTRTYLYPVGANFLGYINEVDDEDLAQESEYYRLGDLTGRVGLERQYEAWLRGRKGVKLVLEDVHGREIGPFANGENNVAPQRGLDLTLSVDVELQQFAEKLMENKKGAVVALEPATGEILAMVSAPTYDPNRLSGANFKQTFKQLERDSLNVLYNRAMMAMYPPGSIFKLLTGLYALQEGTLNTSIYHSCYGGFARNGGRPACHAHPSPLNVQGAIKHSCNSFFSAVYVDQLHHPQYANFETAFDAWRRHMHQFGIGRITRVDLPNENPGMLPTRRYYDKIYGQGRWKGLTIVSNAIGQGEILMTPLQMAQMASAIANRGWYIQPHFFKAFRNPPEEVAPPSFDTLRLDIARQHFDLVVNAMEQVVEAGTGWLAQTPGISICGKTGTSQNVHGEDHAVFIAFAPKDTPQIAVACIVENAGFGGVWAAPIASLVIEHYLHDSIANPWKLQRILNANFIEGTFGPAAPAPAEEDSLEPPEPAPVPEFSPVPEDILPGEEP